MNSNRSLTQHPINRFHLDPALSLALLVLVGFGFVILYSASNQHTVVLYKQMGRMAFAMLMAIVIAQIPPEKFRVWAPYLFVFGILMLITVLVLGHTSKGARRWLNLGFFRFQPSEVMKLIVPMTCAWYLSERPLPPKLGNILVTLAIMTLPALLIMKQPDLGTALLIMIAGAGILFLAGLPLRLIIFTLILIAASTPLLLHFMHDYQRQRILTFLNPERDPLGAGYHIIQSKIAIGSGGIFGKGWLNGTQSHLQFLPEHTTDFIFAVAGEEFGLIGALLLIILYAFISIRGFYISLQAHNTFSRLVAGGITLTFFISAFVNIGMVTGILPVVGVPLPLVSYGGTSSFIMIASFGILMSIHTHRRLVRT